MFFVLMFAVDRYGLKHVQTADEAAAIDVLLLTSDLFRVDDVAMRKV
jgi:stalled ribosome rescue protein Dom34